MHQMRANGASAVPSKLFVNHVIIVNLTFLLPEPCAKWQLTSA
jgi:hypothetical protein|tara:strand:+ start:129 stop:257 length:129 start_codon:yes stop_codon:yes gene_type:complete